MKFLSILFTFLIFATGSCRSDDENSLGVVDNPNFPGGCDELGVFTADDEGECTRCFTEGGSIQLGSDQQFCFNPRILDGYISHMLVWQSEPSIAIPSDTLFWRQDVEKNRYSSSGVGDLTLGWVPLEVQGWDIQGCESADTLQRLGYQADLSPIVQQTRYSSNDATIPNGSSVSFLISNVDANANCRNDIGRVGGVMRNDTAVLTMYWEAMEPPFSSIDTVGIDTVLLLRLPDRFQPD